MFKTQIIKAHKRNLSEADLNLCLTILRSGGLIVFPTDTVYGLATSAFNLDGVQRVYSLKGRSYTKPLPLLLASLKQLSLVAEPWPKEAELVMEAYWPGALTLVFKTAPLALLATRGKATVAIRVPNHGIARQILDKAPMPLAATSANKSGDRAVTTGEEVKDLFFGKVHLIIDGGRCVVGQESTVLDVTHYPFSILRQGAISKRDLSKIFNL